MRNGKLPLAFAAALVCSCCLRAGSNDKFLVESPYDHITLSPSGNHIALVENAPNGARRLKVADTESFDFGNTSVSDGKGGDAEITDLRWLNDQWIVTTAKGDDGDVLLHCFELGSKSPRRMAKDGARDIVATVPGSTRFIILEKADGKKRPTSRFIEYDAAKGEGSAKPVYETTASIAQGCFDASGALRLVKKQAEGESEAWFRLEADGSESKLSNLAPWNRLFGLHESSHKAIVAGSFGGAPSALVTYDIAKDAVADIITTHPKFSLADLGQPVFDPATRGFVGLNLDGFTAESFWTDPKLKETQGEVDQLLPGAANRILSWNASKDRLLVKRVFPMLPSLYCYVEPAKKRVAVVVLAGGPVKPEEVGATKLVDIPNRDGTAISSILTFPRGKAPENLPLLVWLGKDVWGSLERVEWDPVANYFAAQGYLVARINCRGKQGLIGPWSADQANKTGIDKSFQDIEDVIEALVAAGVADPKRVGIGGESSGAWAAAYATKRSPQLYQAALCLNGVYDTVAARDPKSGGDASAGVYLPFAQSWSNFPSDDLRALSAVEGFSDAPSQVFVAYGKWSPAENKTQNLAFIKAAKKAGASVKSYYGDWWGSGLSAEKRFEAFDLASRSLKAAFK